jgi:hypothetical protein
MLRGSGSDGHSVDDQCTKLVIANSCVYIERYPVNSRQLVRVMAFGSDDCE